MTILPLQIWSEPTQLLASFVVRHRPRTARRYIEPLGKGIGLAMIEIPGGRFLMGSPEHETDRYSAESPEHPVTVPPFFLGKYPVTQAQWRAVAALPKIDLDLDPNPSQFNQDAEGDYADHCPVEQVNWHEATEACARLAQATGRPYRLPSEAEWEYACRAGTSTPFHFDGTLTTDVANYCGQDREIHGKTYSGSYGCGPKGDYRQKTTQVGLFPPNAFGLHDMHGNVWEWCLDLWHNNYDGAPEDGNAWIEDSASDSRLVRGGSWFNIPRYCRSACRLFYAPGDRGYDLGFRFCCSFARTP